VASFQKHSPRVKYLVVYILEAHFVETLIDPETGEKRLDGWPIGNAYRIPQHKSLEERLQMASQFREDFGMQDIEFCVDTMDNSFNKSYAAWPDSAYFIRKGRLEYRAKLEEEGLRSKPFTHHIEQLLPTTTKQ